MDDLEKLIRALRLVSNAFAQYVACAEAMKTAQINFQAAIKVYNDIRAEVEPFADIEDWLNQSPEAE